MKQTLFIPFQYDVQVLNFYLYSYFADVKVQFNELKMNGFNQANSPKFDIKFTVEDINIYYFEKA